LKNISLGLAVITLDKTDYYLFASETGIYHSDKLGTLEYTHSDCKYKYINNNVLQRKLSPCAVNFSWWGIAYNSLNSSAGWSFILLVGPPKSGRLKSKRSDTAQLLFLFTLLNHSFY